MGVDAAQNERRGPHPDWSLPEILEIQIARIPFKAPEYRHFKSVYADYEEAIEFLVRTDRPFPIRALSPVLYVGDKVVSEGGGAEDGTYRFLAFEFDGFETGQPIMVGWPGQPAELRKRTGFRFDIEQPGERK